MALHDMENEVSKLFQKTDSMHRVCGVLEQHHFISQVACIYDLFQSSGEAIHQLCNKCACPW